MYCPDGYYRAQYWTSAQNGLAANAFLLAALASKLLGAADITSAPDVLRIDICASLHAASAKLWICEGAAILMEPTVDLAVERWANAARSGVELARWGVSAPEVVKFEIKGAWMDPYGNEVVPVRKIRRHYDIYHYGFT